MSAQSETQVVVPYEQRLRLDRNWSMDVIALIETLGLSAEFADQVNPYVRDKYFELWQGIRDSPVGPVEA